MTKLKLPESFRIGHFEEFPAPSCGAGRQDSSNHRKNYLFCWMRDPELYPYKPFICHWHPGRKRASQMTSTYYKACYSALVREFQYERQPTRFSHIVSIPTFFIFARRCTEINQQYIQ